MPTTVKQLMEAANAVVPKITPAQARDMIVKDNTLLVDVRDAPELEKSGKVAGAVHHSRGMLEFRADPESSTTIGISPARRSSFSIARPAGAPRSPARCLRIWATTKFITWAPLKIGLIAVVRSKRPTDMGYYSLLMKILHCLKLANL